MTPSRLIGMFATVVVLAFCTAASADPKDVIAPEDANAVVAVSDVTVKDHAVTGVVINRSSHPVRDVELLVRHHWLWYDERHPGSNNPGRATRYILPVDVAPGASVSFNFHTGTLPVRNDGYFKTSAEVISFNQVGGSPPQQAALPQGASAQHGSSAQKICRCD